MQKSHLASILFSLLILISNQLHSQTSNSSFTKQQIQEDLAFLKLNLEKYHPNLYQYSSPEDIQDFFQNLTKDIETPLSIPESFQRIASTSVIVKDGHYAFTPDANTLDGFYTSAKLLPLDLYCDGEDSYILRNFSDNEKLKPGQQVLSINRVPMDKIQQKIMDCVLRDGDNKTYPRWIFNNFLCAFYCFCYGDSEEYFLELQDEKEGMIKQKILGLNYDQLQRAQKEKYPSYHQAGNMEIGLSLEIDKEDKMALMTIPAFDKAILKKTYQQKFKTVIKEFMQRIQSEKLEHLVIDLRGNQGGEVSNAIYLLQHLIDEPFVTVLSHQKVSKKNYTDPTQRLIKAHSSVDGIKKPKTNNHFKGEIYVLINGGSFSASGIFAQALKKYNKATFIGEEAGGNAYTLVGLPEKKISLPHTKIQVIIPRTRFNLQEKNPSKMSGVYPDIKTIYTLQDLLANTDIDLIEVKKLTKNEK